MMSLVVRYTRALAKVTSSSVKHLTDTAAPRIILRRAFPRFSLSPFAGIYFVAGTGPRKQDHVDTTRRAIDRKATRPATPRNSRHRHTSGFSGNECLGVCLNSSVLCSAGVDTLGKSSSRVSCLPGTRSTLAELFRQSANDEALAKTNALLRRGGTAGHGNRGFVC